MSSWKDCCVNEETSLLDVLKVIDRTALQLALVVLSDLRLSGIITDGDVRRALLRGMGLAAKAKEFMNRNPVRVQSSQGKTYVANLMRKRKLHQVPVLDDQEHLVDLYTLEDVLYKKDRNNAVILMAGGLGTRLRPLTDKVPKPLLKVGSKPILETILENFIESGFHRFYLSVNYKSEMIEKYFGDGSRYGVEIRYLHENKRMGTAGPLYFLPEKLVEPAIVMNGDLLTKVDFGEFIDYHVDQGVMATMGVREYSYQVSYGVIEYDGRQIRRIKEKPTQTFYVSAGMYVLSPEAVAHVREEKFFDMPDLFNQLIEERMRTTVYPVREYWMDIGRLDDFRQAQDDYGEIFEHGENDG